MYTCVDDVRTCIVDKNWIFMYKFKVSKQIFYFAYKWLVFAKVGWYCALLTLLKYGKHGLVDKNCIFMRNLKVSKQYFDFACKWFDLVKLTCLYVMITLVKSCKLV